ncbi:ACT domain-containing protein [Paracidovorax cattleyae]|uniref:Uncharacterized protein n=1 Tax=Paracidovorax cattleyae TaxID=80868 RepID=A0A1H0VIN9_9BURK|nr:ACT domain-containing protein [Paracidovorax cattleyae]AVS72752.1 ACT domain-containing protein [Paracidovorax cattleyae]MBF9264117.1 ACT domain-containing protein [Paracidovorax cattleyae]SDP78377.1 hypothetical protein SAMN04489708_12657 [Paracidovorax cattleyae]
MTLPCITLAPLPFRYAVSRLAPSSAFPEWADGDGFVSVTRTSEELSVVCRQERVPSHVQAERDWKAFRFVGPFAFGATGIVLSVVQPLSKAGIGVFVVSTFDGDHLLLQERDTAAGQALLMAAGHTLLPET